jgi:hypothetical protein
MINWICSTARTFAVQLVSEAELMHEGMPVLICMEDEPVHTDDHPYCGDMYCPCSSIASRDEIREQVRDGLMTYEEGLQLYRGENI